jgi:hypothetical protein
MLIPKTHKYFHARWHVHSSNIQHTHAKLTQSRQTLYCTTHWLTHTPTHWIVHIILRKRFWKIWVVLVYCSDPVDTVTVNYRSGFEFVLPMTLFISFIIELYYYTASLVQHFCLFLHCTGPYIHTQNSNANSNSVSLQVTYPLTSKGLSSLCWRGIHLRSVKPSIDFYILLMLSSTLPLLLLRSSSLPSWR